jgi:hypothetical protein
MQQKCLDHGFEWSFKSLVLSVLRRFTCWTNLDLSLTMYKEYQHFMELNIMCKESLS